MKSAPLTILLAVLTATAFTGCRTYPDVGCEVTRLATGFKFTEGPASSDNGDIYFTDIQNSRIHIWSPKNGLSTFREDSGRANGLFFHNETLFICEGNNGKVTSVTSDGEIDVVADSYDGKKLNSPNDLWVDSRGGVYFTDPRYGKSRNTEQKGEHVYYVTPDRQNILRVTEDLTRPNGIIGTADGTTLYVADHGGKKTFKYVIATNGKLSGKRLLIKEGSDGMTLDTEGNLYITTDAVRVYAPSGKLLRVIEVPERPSNVCFGIDAKTLFITARTSIYAIKIK